MTFSPFFSHQSFIAFTASRIKVLTFSQISMTAFRKSSLVSHSRFRTTTAIRIAAIINPTFENSNEPIFTITPTREISFPTTNSNGPIAAAKSAITTMFFFVPALKFISLFVSGVIYFCNNCRMIGIRMSPNCKAISSTSDFKIFI